MIGANEKQEVPRHDGQENSSPSVQNEASIVVQESMQTEIPYTQE